MKHLHNIFFLMKRWSVIAVLIILCSGISVEADDTILVASEAIKGLSEKDGSGLYWDILRAIYEPQGVRINIKSYPYVRGMKMLQQNNVDALLNARQGEIEGVYYPRWHYSANFIAVIVKKERFPDWKGEYSLAYKTIGLARGYNYQEYLYIPIEVFEINDHNRVGTLLMLKENRIDAFLDSRFRLNGTLTDFADELNKKGFLLEDYRIENLIPSELYLAFSDTERGWQLADLFDKGFEELLNSGQLKALFNKWNYTPFPFE